MTVQNWMDLITQALVQVLMIVVPVLITWFIRTYVRPSAAEKKIGSIIRLSNNAIKLVERWDQDGALDLPPGVKKGVYKSKMASDWLESELKRNGIKVTNEEAQQWITSEFQKLVGDVKMVSTIAKAVSTAADLVQTLEESDKLDLPTGVDRITYSAELAADWVVANLTGQGVRITPEEALTYTRAEFVERLQNGVDTLPTTDRLQKLAQKAVAFLDELKASGKLAIKPGMAGENVETDIAAAWLVTESAKQGLAVTSDEIAAAVQTALGR